MLDIEIIKGNGYILAFLVIHQDDIYCYVDNILAGLFGALTTSFQDIKKLIPYHSDHINLWIIIYDFYNYLRYQCFQCTE